MDPSPPPPPLQSIRIAPQCLSPASANPVHSLPARLDPETKRHFILWKDIQALINPQVMYVAANGAAVYFMEGDNFERLEPLRIAYHPGTVLDVVVPVVDICSASDMAVATTEPAAHTPASSLYLEKEAARLRIQDVPDPSREDTDPSSSLSFNFESQKKGRQPEIRMSLVAQTSVQVFQGLRTSCIQAIMTGQLNHAEGIKAEMSKHFQEVKVETDKLNSAMKENAALQAKLLEMNETMVEMQKMTLDRLANIQGQIQAVLTQTYELHEYPIPRLFIILPTVLRRRNAYLKPFSDQFRLYFLCECGSHTTREGSKETDKVHLADHPGYDIERRTEFFRKYGPYILAVMRAIQLGARVASIVVPHLVNSTLAQELKNVESTLESLQKGIDFYSKENIGTLVDQTVSYLEDLSQRHEERGLDGNDPKTSITQSVMNNAEVIEGVELKQLENFLSVTDKERTLGNLYRSVTKEGHVKWVCRTHFRQNYRDQAHKRLLEVVVENSGEYDEQLGKVAIRLDSKSLAKAFYAALIQTAGIQELDINIQWNATLYDIRQFAEAITNSTVVSLCVRNRYFDGSPVSDLLNNGRRYDPILQLMAKGKLQMIRLLGFSDFLERVSSLSTIKDIRSLCTLEIHFWKSNDEILVDLIKRCTGLQKLKIYLREEGQVMNVLSVSRQLLELEVICSGDVSKCACTLAREIAKLKDQYKGDNTEHRICLRSLVVSRYFNNRDATKAVSIAFSENGIAGISIIDIGEIDLRLFTSRYGWALLDLDLVPFQFMIYRLSMSKTYSLTNEAWSHSIDLNGGVSALESLRFHGFLVLMGNRSKFLSIIKKSPKLKRLEIVFDIATCPSDVGEVVSWHLKHLASKITTLDLSGYTRIKAVVDYIERHNMCLPKLTEFRWESDAQPLNSHRIITKDRWCQLFAAMDFAVLTTLAIYMETFEDFWCALIDSLPKDGLLDDGTPVALTLVEYGLTVSTTVEEDQHPSVQQFHERAPGTRLKYTSFKS